MISQSTPCWSPRPEESWLGSKRQWREWEMSWRTNWQSWRVSTAENSRLKDSSPGSIKNWRKQTTLKCKERFETESESSRVYSLTSSLKDRQGSKPSPQTEQPSGPRSIESVRHSGGSSMKTPTGWAHSHPVLWAGIYNRIDYYSNRHGDLDPYACAHRRWGKCAGAGSQASWQEWFKSVGEKHLQALWRALANLAGKAAAALPGIIGLIVSWLLNTLGKTATWLAENLWALAIAMGPCLSWTLGTG